MLAKLGEAALEAGLKSLIVPCLPTAKNQPALDFFSSVGAEYKEPLSESYLFRFPAEVAAECVIPQLQVTCKE
jgi:hypothetical protein